VLGIRATVNSAAGGAAGGSTFATKAPAGAVRPAGAAQPVAADSVVDVGVSEAGAVAVGVDVPASVAVGVDGIGSPDAAAGKESATAEAPGVGATGPAGASSV